jgi:hypothetical protein
MPRKPTKIQLRNALFRAHEGYTAHLWTCTGHHKDRIRCLNIVQPLTCSMGHQYIQRKEVSIKTYLKKDLTELGEKE